MERIKNILMVEDDENDVLINTRKINRSKIKYEKLSVCNSLSSAKEYIKTNRVDLVLLDLNLPDTNGLDIVKKLREFYDGLLIVVTSLEKEVVGVESIRLGADEFITKNDFNEDEIFSKVYFGLERRKRWERVNDITKKIDAATILGDKLGK